MEPQHSSPTPAPLDTVDLNQSDYNSRQPRWLIPVEITAVLIMILTILVTARAIWKIGAQNQRPPPTALAAEVALAAEAAPPQMPEELVPPEPPSASSEDDQ